MIPMNADSLHRGRFMKAFDFLTRFLQFGSKKRPAQRSRRPAPFRPWLEPLEIRCVPATFTWTGAVSDAWSDPLNWAENRVPESGPEADIDRNDVLIFPESATRTTSVNDISGNAVHAAEIQIVDDFSISGGALRLDSSVGQSRISLTGKSPLSNWSVSVELTAPTIIHVNQSGSVENQLRLDGILSGPGGIRKEGHGALILGAHNTYANTTAVAEGILEVQAKDALGATGAGTTIAEDGTLRFGQGSAGGEEPLTVKGQVLAKTDTSWAGPVTLDPSSSFNLAFIRVDGATSDLTLSGPVSGNAGLVKEGAGTLVFAGDAANSYTGATQVREGRLDLKKTPDVHALIGSVFVGIQLFSNGSVFFATDSEVRLLSDNQIPNTVAISIGPNGLLDMNGRSDTVGELTLHGGRVTTGVGTLTLNGNVIATSVDPPGTEESAAAAIEGNLALGSATRTFAIEDGPAATDVTVAAAISGTGGLTKTGAGRLRLSGTNSYTGATTVIAGRLVVDGNQQSSPVEVRAGGTLAGSGTVGPLTVRSEGIVRPGDSLTVTGNAAFGGFKSVFQPSLVGTFVGALGVTGTLNLNNATLTLIDVNVPGALPPLGAALPIVGAASMTGLFHNLPQNAIAVSASGLPYRVTYTPNNVLVTRLGGPAFVDRAITPVIDEGGVATLTGHITTTLPTDKFFLEVNWGDGTRTQVLKVKPGASRDVALQHRYLQDGTYSVGLLWRDQRGAFNTGALQLTVRNVAPTVFAGEDLTLKPHGVLARHGRALDPGARDLLTTTVDYGDGTGSQPLRLNKHGQFVLHHRYSQPGDYRVTVTVRDDDGGVSTDNFRVTVLAREEDGDANDWIRALDAVFSDSLQATPGWKKRTK